MIDPARRRQLIREVGTRRILAAPDLTDTWSRRLAAMVKPAAVIRALVIASVSIAIAACASLAAGYSLTDRDGTRLSRLVVDLVPDVAILSDADLRIRFRAAARAITFIDQAIMARPADPASLTWFERVFGRPAPQVDPGREAVLIGIVDRLAALPADQRADAIENMMLWVSIGQNQEAWKVMKSLAGLLPEARKALLADDFGGLRQVLTWLHERQADIPTSKNLSAAVERHRLELADENKALEAVNQSLRQGAEDIRGRRFACRRQTSELETCLGRKAP